MKITLWSILDEKQVKEPQFNHIEDGWSDEKHPLPIKPEYTNQSAWQNHLWLKEFGWLINGKVMRNDYTGDERDMDISSGSGYPSASLSNFTPHPFAIDGVECTSMEGFLQSLKFKNPDMQVEVCKLFGGHAKKKGSKKNKHWKKTQTLYWQGEEIPRKSDRYQELLDKAYGELAKNNGFQKALLATGKANLTHSMGRNKENETVLTTREFCGRLMRIRSQLQKNSI